MLAGEEIFGRSDRGEAQCLGRALAQAAARQHTTEGCWDAGGGWRRVEGAGSRAEAASREPAGLGSGGWEVPAIRGRGSSRMLSRAYGAGAVAG